MISEPFAVAGPTFFKGRCMFCGEYCPGVDIEDEYHHLVTHLGRIKSLLMKYRVAQSEHLNESPADIVEEMCRELRVESDGTDPMEKEFERREPG